MISSNSPNPVLKILKNSNDIQMMRKEAVTQFILTLSDQQLVTGIAILLGACPGFGTSLDTSFLFYSASLGSPQLLT